MINDSASLNIMSAVGLEQIDILSPVTFLGEVSVESQTAVEIIEQALTEVQNNLTDFSASATFDTDMLTVFGESADIDLGRTIIDALAVGEELPQIIVAPAEQMNGAAGGFDSLNGTVYLADSLINQGFLPVTDVLVEEFGHLVDSELNIIDTPGDEGAWFAAKVRGDMLSDEDVALFQQEDDKMMILGGLVEVEADDSFETAIDFGVIEGENYRDEIGSLERGELDKSDYYRFELKEESGVKLTLNGLRENADLTLYDNAQATIFKSSNSGRRFEKIEVILENGVYYLEVSSVGRDKTPYSLSISAEEEIIDDYSTPELANDLGKLTQGDTIITQNEVGRILNFYSQDRVDWYSFRLEEESIVDINLRNLRQNANLKLYDDNGNTLLYDSKNSGSLSERITEILEAGNYYLEVSPVGNARTDYSLDLDVEEVLPPIDEFDIGTLTTYESLDNNIGFTRSIVRNHTDRYSFTLPEESGVIMELFGLRADANLKLFDENNIRISSSVTKGTTSEEIEEILEAGNYYLEVSSVGNAKTTYSLDLFAEEVRIDPDGYPSSSLFQDIGNLTNLKSFSRFDNIGFASGFSKDTEDWYGFELEEESLFNLSLTSTDNLNLELFSDRQELIADSRKGNKDELIVTFLEPGNYFFRVTPQGSARGAYELTASIETQDITPPEITISDATITEGNKGRKNAKFQVTLDGKSNETVKVNYTTANDTAKVGKDYRKTNGTLTFKPGQTKKTITVPILGDTLEENNEKFNLNLSKPKNATFADKRGIGTIRNDDKTLSKISIGDAQITEGDNGKKQLKFDVTLNTKVNQRVEVNYATADDTAQRGSDYQRTQGKLVFKPNQKKKTITVPILGDTFKEEDETFTVNLSNPKNGKLGDKRGIGRIKDNGDTEIPDGDTFENPINLGTLVEREVSINDIGATQGIERDTDDYYRFEIKREGTLRVFLDSLFEDANVELLGSGEDLISQSEKEGLAAEEIIQPLDPDIYYVRVYPSGSDRTPYRLSLTLI